MNKARAMLDALMGPGRNVLDKGPKNEKFKDSSVCKSFLVGFCPLESSRLGGKRKFEPCARIHSELMKEQLNAHADSEKLRRDYEVLFLRDLEYVVRECDGHIANERQRIREDNRKKKAPLPVDVNARLSAMKREAEGLLSQSKALDDDQHREKESLESRAKEIMADREAYMEVESKKAADSVVPEEICEICGTAYEGPKEKENHMKYKVHKTYEKVRKMIPELKQSVDETEKRKKEEREAEFKKKRKEEWEANQNKETGSDDKKRSKSRDKEEDKDRDRDREKDRERDKDRDREKIKDKDREKDKEKARERDRDREKRDKSREKGRGDGGRKSRGGDGSRERSKGRKRNRSCSRSCSRSRSGGRRKGRKEQRRRSRS